MNATHFIIKCILMFFLVITNSTQCIQNDDEFVSLNMKNKNLGDVLQILAEKKNINILLPTGTEAINSIINFSTPEELPLAELEEYILYFIDMAGYRFSLQDDLLIISKKNDASVPLYVNIPPESLPDNPGSIRAIYFLKNLKVQHNQAIAKIILDIFPEKSVQAEPRSNALILTGPSNSVAAAMTIVTALDTYGMRDEIASLKLLHTSAATVSKLLEEILVAAREPNITPNQNVLYNGSSFFSPNIKIIPELRTNSIFFLGKSPSINKLINFVRDELDIPQDSGRCIIHVYPLKYLDARKAAPVLQSLVSGRSQQSQSVRDSHLTNTSYRIFDGARIIAEETVQAQSNPAAGDSKSQNKMTIGGNRLIIAATKEDYEEIEKIIKAIDKPQEQVIIEIMILDLDVEKSGSQTSQTRLPDLLAGLSNLGAQSIMESSSQCIINDPLSPGVAITNITGDTPNSTISGDLLSALSSGNQSSGTQSTNSQSSTVATSLVDIVPRNGIIISLGEQFNNMGIASILRFVESISARHIIDNPSIVAQNNTQTKIEDIKIRRGKGDLNPNSSQYGGATVINIDSYPATLGIGITPRVSTLNIGDENTAQRINLEIDVSIEEFTTLDLEDYSKITRSIKTNACISSGDLLVLGGLYKKGHTQVVTKTPLLGDIPLIGTFFRKIEKQETETNLVIILRATTAQPSSSSSLQEFSKRQAKQAYESLNDNLFGNLKDPITHFYFDQNKSKSRASLENIYLKQNIKSRIE